MKCNQFIACLNETEHIDVSVRKERTKEEKSRKKSKAAKKEKTLLCNFPCADEDRCRNCIIYYDDRQIMACVERDSRYALNKQSAKIEAICFHVDGGMIEKNDPEKRCDYAFFLKDSEKRLILIELKGTGAGHALEQLSAMLEWNEIKEAFRTKAAGRIYGRIVSNRGVPDIFQKERRLLQMNFLHYNGNLKIMNRSGEEKYQELDICT